MKPTVIIFGGGISGLTVAHELAERGFGVKLFEKDPILGGMARSRTESSQIPSEHSWRGYAPFYLNFFDIAKRIPIGHNKTVYDNLSKLIDFYFLKDKLSDPKMDFSVRDKTIVAYHSLKYLSANKRKKDYYKTKATPIIKQLISPSGYDYLINYAVGPGFGMDKDNVSYAHFFKIITLSQTAQPKYKHTHNYNGIYEHEASGKWHEMIKPTNEAWFDPWKEYLEKIGVQIYLNSELIKINFAGDKIISCVIRSDHRTEIIQADNYVICINPFEAEKVFQNSRMDYLFDQHQALNKYSLNNQISFRLGIGKKIKFPIKEIAFVMLDSEFNITWYPQEQYWPDVKLDSSIKSLWSGTCIITYANGKIYGKPAINLNRAELMNEIIYQILRSDSFQKVIFEQNGFYLKASDIVYHEIWYEWKFANGILKQDNKKWVNNIYNQAYRPKQKTSFMNLYIGGAHTRTTLDVWSMESAVESGKIIANYITNGDVVVYKHTDPSYFRVVKYLDDTLYDLCLPNVIDVILIMILVLIIYCIYKYYK